MESVKSIKTTNFRFDVISTDGVSAVIRVSALVGEGKNGNVLFAFDKLSRNKNQTVALSDLWSKVSAYEARLAQLMALKA